MQFLSRAALRWLCIIGALCGAALGAGCSANRLIYNQSPTLLTYWLDAYWDLDGPQSLAMKESLQALQQWHRKEELPLLADLLQGVRAQAGQDVSSAQVCTQWEALQPRIQAPLQRMLGAVAALSLTLQPAQLRHMEAEFARRNREWRAEWLDMPPAQRLEARTRQIVERVQNFYGLLDDSQREWVRRHLAASGYNPEIQHQEMLRRQQDSLQTLMALRGSGVGLERAQVLWQGVFARALSPPDPMVRQYVQASTRSLCDTLAAIHNSSSPAQRARLIKTLQAYEADARALAQEP